MRSTILTIEDQPDIRRLIRMTLEFDGHAVLEASSGEEGLKMVRQHPPDLILLDVMMPGMSGLEVCSALQAHPDWQHIPVVMLTSLEGEADRSAGLHAGAKAYLHKPFGPLELLGLVRELTEAGILQPA